MGAALGGVFNGSGSATSKIKKFAENQGGQHGLANAIDPGQLDWFATSGDRQERAAKKADEAQAASDAALATQTASDEATAAAEEDRRRLQLGGGRASTMLTSGDSGSGGRRYLGAA